MYHEQWLINMPYEHYYIENLSANVRQISNNAFQLIMNLLPQLAKKWRICTVFLPVNWESDNVTWKKTVSKQWYVVIYILISSDKEDHNPLKYAGKEASKKT